MYTLSIYRQRVAVSLAEAFVCGGIRDQFEYEAKIQAKSLDRRGFVLDVKQVIDNVGYEFGRETLKASCEELCNGVLHTILATATAEAVALDKVSVRVKNLTGHVELAWEADEEAPKFPRKATAKERAEGTTSRTSYQPKTC
jgi:hypothetical protein